MKTNSGEIVAPRICHASNCVRAFLLARQRLISFGSRYFRRIGQPLRCARRICIGIFHIYVREQISASGIYLNSWALYTYVWRLHIYICVYLSSVCTERWCSELLLLDAEPLPSARVHCIIQFWSLAIKKRNKGRTIARCTPPHGSRRARTVFFSPRTFHVRPRTWAAALMHAYWWRYTILARCYTILFERYACAPR